MATLKIRSPWVSGQPMLKLGMWVVVLDGREHWFASRMGALDWLLDQRSYRS